MLNINSLKEFLKRNKFLRRYLEDVKLRVNVSLNVTLFFNSVYALFQLALGLYHSSIWYCSFSAYYMMLAIMRFYLLKYSKNFEPCEDMLKELFRYRFCAIIMLMLNVILSVIVFYITWKNQGFDHNIFTTVVIAVYTTVSVVKSLFNLIRYRKYKSPVFSAAKIISVASALVSLLTLESALFSGDGNFRRFLTGATGFIVLVFVLSSAVYMIIYSNKKIQDIKKH